MVDRIPFFRRLGGDLRDALATGLPPTPARSGCARRYSSPSTPYRCP
ncbi:hypothetical protein [Frankia sp. CcWB3]